MSASSAKAQAVAALSHPNIVTIHSVERMDDVSFLTMELVQGRPLTDLIPHDGLPVDRLLQLAIPLADAISAAHARGIPHRDLKPANVLVTTAGHVKVLDFGLAKLADSASGPLTGVSELATMALATELVSEARKSPGRAYGLAAIFAALNENDQAFARLERAYNERDGNMLSLAVAVEFDGLRADPRFKDLIRRIGIPVSRT